VGSGPAGLAAARRQGAERIHRDPAQASGDSAAGYTVARVAANYADFIVARRGLRPPLWGVTTRRFEGKSLGAGTIELL
ncbi:MAG: hypothetical protein JSW47_11610, partial [Phycisphaerales bacterium]